MSAIEWTDDTENVQIGCSRVSDGCKRCYAEAGANSWPFRVPRVHSRYLKVIDGKGRWNGAIYLDEAMLARGPTSPKRKKTATGWRPTRVFIGSMTDHFHEKVTPVMFAKVIRFMQHRPATIWQMVTKRPHRAQELLREAHEDYQNHWRLATVWPRIHLLATVEDQRRAEERVPQLLKCEPYVELLGLSVEPLLERVTLAPRWLDRLGWVIVGGESGSKARVCDIAWIRSIVEQTNGKVSTFVKQLGAQSRVASQSGVDAGIAVGLKHPKGGNMAEWPADLQVQEFPR